MAQVAGVSNGKNTLEPRGMALIDPWGGNPLTLWSLWSLQHKAPEAP